MRRNKLKYLKKIIVLFVMFLFLNIFYNCSNPLFIEGEPVKKNVNEPLKDWTFMIYLEGVNELEGNAIEDFNEMEYGLYMAEKIYGNIQDRLNIVVLFDRIDGFYDNATHKNGNNWVNTRIYHVKPDPDSDRYGYFTSDWIINDIDDPSSWDLNMGDPDSLSWFISYSKKYFPAKHYALILWDHGNGARAAVSNGFLTSKAKEIIWDYENSDQSGKSDALYLDEVKQALAKNFDENNKLDLIGMDACLMGTVEVAYQFRNLAKYFVASMAMEDGDGWDYSDIFKKIALYNGNNLFDIDSLNQAECLAMLLVDSFHDFYDTYYSNQTLSAIDLSKIEELKISIDDLASKIYYEDKKNEIELSVFNKLTCFGEGFSSEELSAPYFDLYSLCKLIINDSTNGFSSDLKTAASNVINKLGDTILKSYAGSVYGGYYDIGAITKRGLSIFISRFYKTDNDLIYYYKYYKWYTNILTENNYVDEYNKSVLYGNIDFCNYDNDGKVETWKELFEAWYDPDNKYTVDTY